MKILLKNINSIDSLPQERPDWMEQMRWERLSSIKANADKKRSLAAGYLLDYMCRDMGLDNSGYVYSGNGKPYFADAVCAFNLSHSGDYALLAYHGTKEPVGVDIQKIRTMRDGMEKRILHEDEKKFLSGDSEWRNRYLNRIWSVKESFVKMTGEGLARDFRTVYTDFENGTVATEDGISAYFRLREWKEDYYLSICSPHREEYEIKEV